MTLLLVIATLFPGLLPWLLGWGPRPLISKKRLDRANYCFRTQVFEVIGAILDRKSVV